MLLLSFCEVNIHTSLIETNLVKCDIIHLSFSHSTSQAYIRPLRVNLTVGASQLKDKNFWDNFKKKLSIDANKTNTIYDGEQSEYY